MPDVVLNTKHPGTESLNAIRYWSDDKFALKEDKIASSFIVRLSFEPELIGQPWVLTGGTERYTGTVKSTPDDVTVDGIDDNFNPIVYTLTTNTIEGIEIIRFFEFIQTEKYYPFGVYAVHITTDTHPYATDNLITYYDAINNTGTGHDSLATTWTDLSGNSNDGIITAGTWEDNALVLNGTNSSGVKKDYSDTSINSISIEVYVASKNTYSSGNAHIISKWVNDGFIISIVNGLIRFYVYSSNGGSVYIENYKNIIAGTYTHYVGTYDGQIMKLYVDGKLVSSKNTTSRIISTNSTLSIGRKPNSSGDFPFNGKIRSFRMYYRALTEEEIKYNYSYERYRYELKGEVL